MEKSLPDIAANSMGFAVASEHYRPYPTYRDSGVEWLGKIPSHWKVKKISHLFAVGSGTTPPTDYSEYYGGGIPWVTTSELRESVVTSTEKSVTKKALRAFSALNLYPKGSIAVAMYGATIGRLGILGTEAAVNQACCVFSKPEGIEIWFWFYWLQFRRPYLISLGYGGGQPNLSQELLKSIRVPIPPLHEQRNIVHSLDRDTAKVDELVAKKERLIELLQEKRTALITRAVTKGIDPDAPMKDSGVEWLGEIPSHWETKRVAELALSLQTGPFGSQLHAADYITGGIPIINPANLIAGTLVPDPDRTVDEPTTNRLGIHKLLQGDILFARRGDVGRCGLVGKQHEGWLCGTGCLRMRPCPDSAESSYLLNLLSTQGVGDWLGNESVGSTMQNLNTSIIGRIPVAIPGLSEQCRISEFLDCETTKIDALVAKVQEAIDRLKELRTAVISAAVTGKVDVREAAP